MVDPRTVRMGTDCAVHRHRELVPMNVHHVWPLGDGGPDEPWNEITVCMNGHGSIHALLDLYKKHDGPAGVPWSVKRQYGRRVRALAAKGYDAIQNTRHILP
jgi:hypothetical protein